jgi:hypothetical protein
MVPSPMPDEVFKVSQVASEVKVHEVLELIAKLVLPASASTTLYEGVTDRIYMPFWVTVTCCDSVPGADTVMTAILAVESVFAVNEAVKVPLPLPVEGLNVSQSASSVIVHKVFELIENVVLPASASTSLLGGVTDRTNKPFCVNVACCGVAPLAVILIIAVLAEANELAVNTAVTVPLPLPDDGLIVNQSASSEIVHKVFELTVKVVLPASAATTLSAGVILNVIKPFWVRDTTWGETAPDPVTVILAVLAAGVSLAV